MILPRQVLVILIFYEPTDEELCKKVRKLMKETRYSGIFSIDLLIEKDGKIYFLEVNFRNSAWSYPSTCAGVNLPVIWAKSILGNKLDVYNVSIKKLPYSAISDQDELSHSLHQGFVKTLKALKRIWKCNCCVIWNREDQGPFWNIVIDFIKRKI